MSLAETLVLAFVAGWCLFLAWAIDRGGAVGLIAGYQQGQYSEVREAELVRDVRNLLLVVVALVGVLVVDAWTCGTAGGNGVHRRHARSRGLARLEVELNR